MDRSTEQIVAYADRLTFDQLSADCVHAAKAHLVDSVACLLGGFDSPPARIARQYARSVSARPSARVLGDGTPTAPDVAAFANTIMLRYLDYNDTLVATGSLHPSDVIPAILAAAETAHATGRDLLLGIVLGYEIAGALCRAVSVRERGWDQGVFLGIAGAVAAGKLLGLDRPRLANALSLAVVPHVPLRQTRAGELSMWKGCATADSARNAIFAAQLARLGLTAPREPFEGKDGLWERVTGAFELSLPDPSGTSVIEQTNVKLHPAEYHSQAFLDLVPAIRQRVSVADIDALDIETYWVCYSEIGAEPAKWQPESRETADHSLPFILATALRDGELGLDSFSDENIHDPGLRQFMQRITVRLNDEFTRRFPTEVPSRVRLRTRSGEEMTFEASYAKGHYRNPATPSELDGKFRNLADRVLSSEQGEMMQTALAEVEACEDVADLVERLKWK
jgi:2-methylcitrate dehydratase